MPNRNTLTFLCSSSIIKRAKGEGGSRSVPLLPHFSVPNLPQWPLLCAVTTSAPAERARDARTSFVQLRAHVEAQNSTLVVAAGGY